MTTRRAFIAGAVTIVPLAAFAAETAPSPDGIRVIFRVDDMGAAQSVNQGCIQACRDGVARSAEVIVPGPWFLDAVRLLKEHADIDVGIHLCLTSEWERVKWRPITRAPSLVDTDGYFRPMTRQRPDFPPDTGFLDANPKIGEVEAELRAQIETIKRHLPNVSHVSSHMGAARATPELRELTQRLAKEYGLLDSDGTARGKGFGTKVPAEREGRLLALVETLGPGTWLVVEHPAVDSPEMRAIGHKGYENVAEDRAAVLKAFTSEKVKDVVKRRGIELISYQTIRLGMAK